MTTATPVPADLQARRRNALLLGSVFVVAACGLVYELVAGALSSYLVGSSVTQFSIVIGLFMFAMGIGSFLSRYVVRDALRSFVAIEIAVGAAGGLSALVLFYAFTFLPVYVPFLVASTLLVGTLVGLEIPLVIRVLREREALSNAVSSVLALDYVGALIGSLLFPLVLVPWLGLIRSAFLFGLLNVGVAGLALWRLGDEMAHPKRLRWIAGVTALGLSAGLITAGGLTRFAEDRLYQDEILLARDTPYQRIVVTRWRDDLRLFLDGHLQFSSADEARYHESLVQPVLAAVPGATRVLILGGGDGMAAREVFKHSRVQRVDLVDLDPAVTTLFTERDMLSRLNQGAFRDPRMHLHHMDAARFLEDSRESWDVILVDLPDPSSPALARLYSDSFYKLIDKHLTAEGALVTQATSPYYSADAFWCIVDTLRSRFKVWPYHVNVPSFGEWGFALASRRDIAVADLHLGLSLNFLNDATLQGLFVFPGDLQRPPAIEVNHLDRPVLVRYYERGWQR
ncbi:MAG: polyamine aminopropyltransferase, partial [Pseudomonadota bacterium]